MCFKWPQVQAGSSGNETWVGGVDKEEPISGEDPAGTCFLVQLGNFMHMGDIIHVQNKEVEPTQDFFQSQGSEVLSEACWSSWSPRPHGGSSAPYSVLLLFPLLREK